MPSRFVSFAEVKRAVSLEALLDRYGLSEGLTRKGANLAGSCPFCNGKSARQFQVVQPLVVVLPSRALFDTACSPCRTVIRKS